MNYWILSIEAIMNTFSIIESKSDIRFKMSLDSTSERGNILDEQSINAGDKILVFIDKPVGEIRYMLEVTGVDHTHLVLHKSYETGYGLTMRKMQQVDEETYNLLESNNHRQLHQISEASFNTLFSHMFEDFSNRYEVKTEQPVIHETKEDYVAPEKNPQDEHLPHNWIVFGAPGTGKSYQIDQQRKTYFGSNYERVTFHPNFSYGQFVGAYKPRPMKEDKSKITYDLVAGPLLRTVTKAMNHPERNYVLIIEEINRANTAAVFGDIFQLLDRNEDGKSEYNIVASEEVKEYIESQTDADLVNYEIHLPSNLYIWATMNTSDQGVFPLDSAFKRRFDFEFISINASEEKIGDIDITIKGIGTMKWNHFRRTLNDYLLQHVRNIKEDKLIGPFFIKKTDLEASDKHFQKVFQNKLLMYLAEDILKTDKTKLFKYPSFSQIVTAYIEDEENVFSDAFTEALAEQE
ncbi:restriction endonuclease subunit R [Pontibacillus chungwhensis BH030062]|uniref:Restriction endonuclease subunit R n=1 Tax=Pontibacillus chungwhensis BH030062 TaxID=1385513 RepID=A0A0A2UXM2_9BACI|nr:AAA family ATPase [Pontibacillus chungwhensis]KGP91261.1 restriction endonuclease subunit R [Pontibacillus chungwhensis BH030062]